MTDVDPPSPRWKLVCMDGANECEMHFETDDTGADKLRVGRAVQSPAVWERLLPDENVRNTISREHFEIFSGLEDADGAGQVLWIRNISSKGSLLNGSVLGVDAVRLHADDVVGLGSVTLPSGKLVPALHFRLVMRAAAEAEAEVAAPPAAAATVAEQPHSQLEYVLDCETVCGLPLAEAVSLPVSPTEASGRRQLKVGRAMQAPDFWPSLVADTALLNCISREHFLLEVTLEGSEVSFQNLSTAGTLFNGALLSDREVVTVRPDLVASGGVQIAVPRPKEAGIGPPIVELRLKPLAVPSSNGAAQDAQAIPARTPERVAAALAPAPAVAPAAQGQAAVAPQPAPAVAARLAAEPAPTPLAAPAAIVRISIGALPPPFSLECISARGMPPSKLGQLSRAERFLEASCDQARLRVGRSVQPPTFWATLLPDPTLQNTISREHFEVSMEERGLLLKNLSSSGTWVNGKHTQENAWLREGAVIGLGITPDDPAPVLGFRLVEVLEDDPSDAPGDDASDDCECCP